MKLKCNVCENNTAKMYVAKIQPCTYGMYIEIVLKLCTDCQNTLNQENFKSIILDFVKFSREERARNANRLR